MTNQAHSTQNFSPRIDALAQRLRPIFARIADGAIDREENRILAHEAVKWLQGAGFGALRVPVRYGGYGASLPETFALLAELAEADSNLPQIFRAHFAFVEGRLHEGDTPQAAYWLEQVAQGILFGAAMAELTDSTGTATTLTRFLHGEKSKWVLEGTKYYSTGTLYASWIVAIATDGTDRIQVAVPVDAPGVTRVDDWDGFGQRLTGSGTTHFKNVVIPDENIINRTPLSEFPTNEYFTTYYQLFHLATLAGIGRAIVRDSVAFVRPRKRTFGIPGQVAQRHDPLVQGVIGRLSALSFSADTLVEKVAWGLEATFPQWVTGQEHDPAFDKAQVQAYQAQQIVAGQVLEAANLLFEVGGASATSISRRLDRHWRNARTLASHNPLVQRQRELGDLVINGTPFGSRWREKASTVTPSTSTDVKQEHAA